MHSAGGVGPESHLDPGKLKIKLNLSSYTVHTSATTNKGGDDELPTPTEGPEDCCSTDLL